MTDELDVNRTVSYLVNAGFSISKYERVQQSRKDRLKYWEEKGLLVIRDEEIKLIEFGEKVLEKLKQRYNANN